MNKLIKIYTLTWCSHCRTLKEYLKNEDLEFENIDVETDNEAAEDIIERTGQSGFPIIDIDGEILIGFDKDKIEKILAND